MRKNTSNSKKDASKQNNAQGVGHSSLDVSGIISNVVPNIARQNADLSNQHSAVSGPRAREEYRFIIEEYNIAKEPSKKRGRKRKFEATQQMLASAQEELQRALAPKETFPDYSNYYPNIKLPQL